MATRLVLPALLPGRSGKPGLRSPGPEGGIDRRPFWTAEVDGKHGRGAGGVLHAPGAAAIPPGGSAAEAVMQEVGSRDLARPPGGWRPPGSSPAEAASMVFSRGFPGPEFDRVCNPVASPTGAPEYRTPAPRGHDRTPISSHPQLIYLYFVSKLTHGICIASGTFRRERGELGNPSGGWEFGRLEIHPRAHRRRAVAATPRMRMPLHDIQASPSALCCRACESPARTLPGR